MMYDSLLSRVPPSRAIRASAWATVPYLIFQGLAMPMRLDHTSIVNFAIFGLTIVLAILAFRRVALGLIALGALGIWTLGRLAATLLAVNWSNTIYIVGSLIPLICATLWTWGAVATIRRMT